MLQRRGKEDIFIRLSKRLQGLYRRPFKTVLVLGLAMEATAAAACFIAYRKANRDPEFRFQMALRPGGQQCLELYYRIGETLNPDLKIREQDLELWRAQGKFN